jgi:hypothetical protein
VNHVRTSLIVPAYNEGDRLETGFARLIRAADEGRVDLDNFEILFVDDGSDDDTAMVARRLADGMPHARVLQQDRNRGKGAAIRAGVRAATTEFVVFTDADMAIDPRQMPSMLAALDETPVAVGSRAIKGHIDYGSWLRTRAGRSFNRLVRAVSTVDLRDTQCGWKGARTSHAKILFHLTTIDGFAFDVEMLARSKSLGWSVTEVPVSWSDVTGSHVRLARDSVTMLRDLSMARIRSSSLPELLGLSAVPASALEAVVAHCSGTLLEAAPILTGADGSHTIVAALLAPADARSALTTLASISDGIIRPVSIEEIARASAVRSAIGPR